MQIIRRRAFARAGLVGNPSDGYYGKTIAFSVRDFSAGTVLYEWPKLEIVPSLQDHTRFGSIDELVEDVKLHGYYGGMRLVKAAIKRFAEFCREQDISLPERTFSIRYETTIPRAVGLAGSSAIIVATLKALMEFYGVDIPLEAQPSLVLSVETGELGIAAGLQDRVVQVYGGLVYMDFSKERLRTVCGLGCGLYEPLDPALLPPLYVAWSTKAAEPTETRLAPLKLRYQQGDPDVHAAMNRLAELTDQAREALLKRDHARLAEIINENFEVRRSIIDLSPDHVAMVEAARRTGASAKFAGSGGAIVGTYADEAMYARLQRELEAIGCRVLKPMVG